MKRRLPRLGDQIDQRNGVAEGHLVPFAADSREVVQAVEPFAKLRVEVLHLPDFRVDLVPKITPSYPGGRIGGEEQQLEPGGLIGVQKPFADNRQIAFEHIPSANSANGDETPRIHFENRGSSSLQVEDLLEARRNGLVRVGFDLPAVELLQRLMHSA